MPYEDRRKQDRDTIRRWAEEKGVDLDLRSEEARQKLRSVAGARK